MRNAISAVGRSIGRHRRAAAATVLAVAVGVAIVTVSPWSVSSYSLNSAGVWVQQAGGGQVHRVDTSVHAVDASVDEPKGAVVVQDGQEALVADPTQLTPLNGATVVNGRATPLGAAYPSVQPDHGGVVLGDGVLAVRGAEHGATEVWVGTFDGSTITLPPHPQIAFANTDQSTVQIDIGRDGTTVAYSDNTHVLEQLVAGADAPTSAILKAANFSAPQLSVADGQGVVLFPEAKTVDFGDGGSSDISAAGGSPELQAWNGTGTSVGLSSDEGLFSVTEGKGVEHLESVVANAPVRPVVDARGCVYGAWGSGAGTRMSRVCPSSGPSVVATRTILQSASASSGFGPNCSPSGLGFRGDALNPVLLSADGCAFVAVGAAFFAIAWSDVTTSSGTQTQIQARDPKAAVTEIHTSPVDLYARVGTDAYLPVLANDYDTAGDQLYVTGVSPAAGAPVPVAPAPASDGRTVVLDLRTGSSALEGQVVTFTYTVANGRGQSNTGAVTVHIIGLHQAAAPPVLLPGHDSPVLYVAKGSSGTYDVLKDWVSLDGMPLSILDASVSRGSSSTVTWSSTGWITVNYDGTPNTVVTVTVRGFDDQTSSYAVTVKDVGPAPVCPDVVDDVAAGTVGQPIVVQPLKNDQDPSGSGLQLGAVTPLDGGPTPSVNNGAVTFPPASAARSWSYTYVAKTNQCPTGSVGYIRTQVVATAYPIATPFTVNVPNGGAATVDVLDHATDPSGGVLALTCVAWTNAPGDPACSTQSPVFGGVTSLIDHTGKLRLVDSGGPPGSVGILTYSVSNATGASTAQIFIVRTVPAAGEPLLVCHTMNATVAPGGVVSVPVLQQSWSSYGRPITVSIPNVPSYPPPSTAWTDGSSIRYFAPSSASGRILIPFEVSTGDVTDGTQDCFVVVQVGTNSSAALDPQNLDVSVVVNGSTTIPVPLTTRYDGTPVDPNGSSVDLVGVSSPPNNGKAVLGADGTSFTYTNGGLQGLDTFQYEVKNQVGTVGTGTVNILVLPTSTQFAPPVAAPDTFRLLPGSTVNLPVLDNDADPQGRPLSVRVLPSSQSTALGASATPDGLDLHVSIPSSCVAKDAAGNCHWVLQYQAVAGAEASVPTTVTIQSAPSAGLPPIAHDVFVAYPKSGTTASLSLASFVTNPGSGAVTFSLPFGPSTASVTSSGAFRVTLQQTSEAIVYTATDPGTNLKASGVIWVPGLVAQPPTLNPDQGPIKLNVHTGQVSVPVDLGQYLSAPQGAVLQVQNCKPSDPDLTITSCQSLHATLTADNSIATGVYTLNVTASASDANGVSNQVTLGIEVDVTGDTVINVFNATVPVTLTDTTSSNPIDLFANVNCGGCQRVDLNFTAPPSSGPVTVQATQGNSVITLTANTGNKTDNSTVTLPVRVCPPSNSNGCKSFDVVAHLVPPTVTVSTTQCVLTVAVNQSGTCDLTQYVSASVSDGATAATLKIGGVTGQPPGWTPSVSGLSLSITPTTYSASPVTLTYAVSNSYDSSTTNGSVVITTQAKPDAPGTPSLGPPPTKSGANQIAVTWIAPSGNGLPIDSYTATATNTSSPGDVRTCKSSVNSCTIGGLSPGSSYAVTVIATNSLGDSPSSPESQAFQTEDKPAPVQGVTVTPDNGGLAVSWNAAAVDPQRPVDTYTATASPGGASCTSPGSAVTCSITSLSNGTPYTVTVTATNSIGTSTASAPVPGTPFTVPDPPTNVFATDPGLGASTTVSWTPPLSDHGSLVTSYDLESSPPGASCTVGDPSQPTTETCTGLTVNPSTDYTFTVKAINQGGPSDPSSPSNQITTSGYSNSSSSPTVTQGSGAADPKVSWNGVQVHGTTSVAKYTATALPGGQTCSTVPGAGGVVPTTCVLTGLTPGTVYSIAITVTFQGQCKSTCSQPLGSPANYWDPVAPSSVGATAGATPGSGVVVKWNAPPPSSGIDHYLVEATLGGSAVGTGCTVAAGATLSCAITSGLISGTSYTFTVQAFPSFTQPGVDPGLSSASITSTAP
jgi:large repetitive protein